MVSMKLRNLLENYSLFKSKYGFKTILVFLLLSAASMFIGFCMNSVLLLFIGIFSIFFFIVFYCLTNTSKRITLLCFLITFFTFLLGKMFFSYLLKGDIGLLYSDDFVIIKHVFVSLYLSLVSIFISFYFFERKGNIRRGSFSEDITTKFVIRKVSHIILIISIICSALVSLEKGQFVQSNGYLSLYTSFSSGLPNLILRFNDLMVISFVAYLSTFPSKKDCKIILISYVLLGGMGLLYAQRNLIVQNLLIVIAYIFIRNYLNKNEGWISKKVTIILALLMPLLMVFFVSFSHFRDGDSGSNNNKIVEFFETQGNSVNVIGNGIRFKQELSNQKFYSLYELKYFLYNNPITKIFHDQPQYKQNTIEMALNGGSYGQSISYYYNSNSYLTGRGLGSCYIAEVYQDFGYLGIIICNMLYGIILFALIYFAKRNVYIYIVLLYSFKSILYAPRATPFAFFDIFSLTNAVIILFCVILVKYIKNQVLMSKDNTKKINMLIISDFFSPQSLIAATRPTKFAKYISKDANIKLTVLTRSQENETHESFDYDVIRIKVFDPLTSIKKYLVRKNHEEISNTSTTSKVSIEKKPYSEVIYFLNSLFQNILFSIKACIYVLKNRLLHQSYMFSTYGEFSPHWIAKFIKSINPSTKWVADFRDPIYQIGMPKWFKFVCKKYEYNILSNCDIMTYVSKGVLETIDTPIKDKYFLPNGFDTEDIRLFEDEKKSDRIKFTYTGTLYKNKSDLSPFFEALSKLINADKVYSENIEIHYAGNMFDELYRQAKLYNVDGCLINHGYISKDKSLILQQKSDALLLATWNSVGSTGIITGKFYEYMMMKKPIVACVSGNLGHSKVFEMIENGNLGYCYEAQSESNVDALMLYIERIYRNDIEYRPNLSYVNTFDYENLASRLIQIFKKNRQSNNKHDKKIVLLTDAYPFSGGENFLETELPYSKGEILIFPYQEQGSEACIRKLSSDNLIVYKRNKTKRNIFNKLNCISSLINLETWDEIFWMIKQKKMNLTNLKEMLYFHNESIKYINWIKSELNDKSEYIFYSYWMFVQAFAAIKLKKEFRNSLSLTRCHGFDIYEERHKALYIPFRMEIFNNMNLICPISKQGENYLKDRYQLDDILIKTYYLGSDNSILKKDNFSSNKNLFKIISCSNINENKRLHLIIDALALVNQSVEWTHIGSGELFDDITFLAKTTLPTNIKFKFIGQIEHKEIESYYNENSYNLFINVSNSEGLPVSIMEACSWGIPVIATNVGGTSEIVINGENGYTIERDFEPQTLANLVNDIIFMDETSYEKMCLNSKKIWSKKFNARKNYLDFYKQIFRIGKGG